MISLLRSPRACRVASRAAKKSSPSLESDALRSIILRTNVYLQHSLRVLIRQEAAYFGCQHVQAEPLL